MFIDLVTAKNEKITVNLDRVLFFTETKKGTTVILDDGMPVELQYDYESLRWRLSCYFDKAKTVSNRSNQ